MCYRNLNQADDVFSQKLFLFIPFAYGNTLLCCPMECGIGFSYVVTSHKINLLFNRGRGHVHWNFALILASF